MLIGIDFTVSIVDMSSKRLVSVVSDLFLDDLVIQVSMADKTIVSLIIRLDPDFALLFERLCNKHELMRVERYARDVMVVNQPSQPIPRTIEHRGRVFDVSARSCLPLLHVSNNRPLRSG